MKIAHLILTHCNPSQLDRLITRLAHKDADIYIHVDRKTNINPYLFMSNHENIFFIENRVKVYWGGYSIVQATLNGFEEILAAGRPYSHINLLSGQDYPIKNINFIHHFFANNPGKIFMHFLSVETEWQEALPRIYNYHLIHWNLPFGTYLAERIANFILPKRKLPAGIIAMGRSQWFTATPESIAYICRFIKENRWVERFFKLSWAPDEMIFQTLLFNSPFKEHMVNDNLLYLDWSNSQPNPEILTMKDAETLKKSGKLFARKFNMAIDSKILDYLDQIIT